MNCLSILTVAANLLAAVAMAYNLNPAVLIPKSAADGKVSAGQKIPITWSGAETSHLNIDLINPDHPYLLDGPYSVALGVNAEDGQFTWTVPEGLPTGKGFQFRVWGAEVPSPSSSLGNSPRFDIVNDVLVKAPTSCHPERPCKVTWDVPNIKEKQESKVDLNLYRVGETRPLAKLATVNASDREFIWSVPADQRLEEAGPVYIAAEDPNASPQKQQQLHLSQQTNSFKVSRWTPAEQRVLDLQEAAKQEALRTHQQNQLHHQKLVAQQLEANKPQGQPQQQQQPQQQPQRPQQQPKEEIAIKKEEAQKETALKDGDNIDNKKEDVKKEAADKKEDEKKDEKKPNGRVEIGKGRQQANTKQQHKNAAPASAQAATAIVVISAIAALLPFF